MGTVKMDEGDTEPLDMHPLELYQSLRQEEDSMSLLKPLSSPAMAVSLTLLIPTAQRQGAGDDSRPLRSVEAEAPD